MSAYTLTTSLSVIVKGVEETEIDVVYKSTVVPFVMDSGVPDPEEIRVNVVPVASDFHNST